MKMLFSRHSEVKGEQALKTRSMLAQRCQSRAPTVLRYLRPGLRTGEKNKITDFWNVVYYHYWLNKYMVFNLPVWRSCGVFPRQATPLPFTGTSKFWCRSFWELVRTDPPTLSLPRCFQKVWSRQGLTKNMFVFNLVSGKRFECWRFELLKLVNSLNATNLDYHLTSLSISAWIFNQK